MAIDDREKSDRVPPIQRGQPITARFLNALGQGVNQALQAIEPPRSLRTRSTADQINELTPLTPVPTQVVLNEVLELRQTTLVEIPADNDPTVILSVERIDSFTVKNADLVITINLDWS